MSNTDEVTDCPRCRVMLVDDGKYADERLAIEDPLLWLVQRCGTRRLPALEALCNNPTK